jgi:hypothetical protein
MLRVRLKISTCTCEDLLIIPDLKYLYGDMNYLFNPYMFKKFYFSKEPILGFSNHPLECQRPIYLPVTSLPLHSLTAPSQMLTELYPYTTDGTLRIMMP